ncbi:MULTISPECIES: type IV pilin protein [Paraburkholderia]|uniref:Prepilin-type N-terminal cleavage/methylation domain-containing protein n=1 Tax=Paraburkholderia dioscoreae TaxID=2604047 RepID=A0A5Q4ZAL0_9BURK|nr:MULTISPECIES: type IV pilin protein [Paraburkholderia]MDR8397502.1 prepilin-type N-terminal cleavage/methylation domain-containing protein [Paraburkholderia sp. USG1]VVD27094.1 Prepilin-type N-terminal cleavage/methylation domain-containing protein [Paraburkholderia dioscoreae]
MKPHTSAFTLLELMITLAIAAVLAVFAVPSYRSHVARTHRIDAASALYRAAQFVEGTTSGSVPTLPPGLDQAPQFGTPVYRLHVLPADDANGGYAIEAAPSESGPMRDDTCGIFTLDATGLRGNKSGTSGGAGGGANGGPNASTPAGGDCWNTTWRTGSPQTVARIKPQ